MAFPAKYPFRILSCVGSRSSETCSIGSFARAEAENLKPFFDDVRLIEPSEKNGKIIFPDLEQIKTEGYNPSVIFFHAPALYDRKKPWRVLRSVLKLRSRLPSSVFLSIVHEFSEAPLHWKARQIFVAALSSGVVTNTQNDFEELKIFSKKILRSRLGPTLFRSDLLGGSTSTKILSSEILSGQIIKARKAAIDLYPALEKTNQNSAEQKWILHPGLLTHGKGIPLLLKNLSPLILRNPNMKFILMGDFGPTSNDKAFAQELLNYFNKNLTNQFIHIHAPDDDAFKTLLLASDLVLLPYEAGVSERRSSFLSAVSCGANVLTSVGRLSTPMELEQSGALTIKCSDIEKLASAAQHALEEREELVLARRHKNLKWAERYSWQERANCIGKFLEANWNTTAGVADKSLKTLEQPTSNLDR